MVEIKQNMWRRCSEHLLGENKSTNTNSISLIHLRNGTYFISRHPHEAMNHHSSGLEAPAAAPVSMTMLMPPCSVFLSRYSFKNKQGGPVSQVVTQENALKCSYKIPDLLKTVRKQPIHHRIALYLQQDMAELSEHLSLDQNFPCVGFPSSQGS